MKSYLELIEFDSFKERFEYLKLQGSVGFITYGWDRFLNQALYNSYEWRKFKDKIIIRDHGCDLGVDGYEIPKYAIIHHINPITKQDIIDRAPCVFDPNNVITVSRLTHNAIHYGNDDWVPHQMTIRKPGDTRLW